MLRRSRGLSQEQLAAELDVSRQAISKWECGDSTPDLDKLRTICTYFGVTTDYLIWENEEDTPKAAVPEKERALRGRNEVFSDVLLLVLLLAGIAALWNSLRLGFASRAALHIVLAVAAIAAAILSTTIWKQRGRVIALLIAATKREGTLTRKLAWGQTVTLMVLALVVVIWVSGNTLSGSAIRQWLNVAPLARHYAIGWVALWLVSLVLCGLVLRNPLSLPLRILLAFSAMALCWLMRWTLLIQVQTVPKFNALFNPYTLPGGTDGWLAIVGTFGLWIALIIIVREALNAIARRMQHG